MTNELTGAKDSNLQWLDNGSYKLTLSREQTFNKDKEKQKFLKL
jgi:hypothetical protein